MEIGTIGEELNIQFRQGADFEFVAEMTNDDDSPVNLTGYTVRGAIRRYRNVEEASVALTCSIVTPLSGTYKVALSAANTRLLKAGEKLDDAASKYVWDLELVAPDNKVLPLYYGIVTVQRRVAA
jgi:hypothetical protein